MFWLLLDYSVFKFRAAVPSKLINTFWPIRSHNSEPLTYNPINFSSVQDFFPIRNFAPFPESHGSDEVLLGEEVFEQQVEEPHAVLTGLLVDTGQFIWREEESGTWKQFLLSWTRRAVDLHAALLVEPENPRDDGLEVP